MLDFSGRKHCVVSTLLPVLLFIIFAVESESTADVLILNLQFYQLLPPSTNINHHVQR